MIGKSYALHPLPSTNKKAVGRKAFQNPDLRGFQNLGGLLSLSGCQMVQIPRYIDRADRSEIVKGDVGEVEVQILPNHAENTQVIGQYPVLPDEVQSVGDASDVRLGALDLQKIAEGHGV